MKIDKRTKLIFGGFALVALGIGLGKIIFIEGQRAHSKPSQISTTSQTTSLDTKKEMHAPIQSESSAATQEAKLAACVASVKAAAMKQGTGFEHGDILVSFDASVQYSEALAILDSFGLAPHNSASSKSDFAAHQWLVVNVIAGEEYKEVCILRNQTGVKYAGLNYTFKLAE